LQVEDVAMDTAVRLLAEQAGLKTARVDDVLYVTTAERAASIAADNRALLPYYGPYAMYGIAGAGGLGGLGGAFGALGIGAGGALGAVGIGGGAFGLGGLPPGGFGGFRVMPAPPLPGGPPPTPPPDKPNETRLQSLRPVAPKTTPTLAAQDPPHSPPAAGVRPELWARPASRPVFGARRSRRRAPSPQPQL
jgi:hypothetical protein